MKKLRNPGPDFWRGLGATVVLLGILAAYLLGWVAYLVDEAFGGRWEDQGGDWTVGGALFIGLMTAYGYVCGYLFGRNGRGR